MVITDFKYVKVLVNLLQRKYIYGRNMMVYVQITFDIHTQIHSFECTKFMQMTSSFRNDSLSNRFLNLKIFSDDQHLADSFASQILIIRPLGTKGMKHRKSSDLLSMFEAEVKLSNIVDQHDI